MLRAQTIAGKITLLVAVVAVFLTALASYLIIRNEYSLAKEQLAAEFEELAARTSHQQESLIRYGDKSIGADLFSNFFVKESLEYAAIFNAKNKLLYDQSRTGKDKAEPSPSFQELRAGVDPFEKSINTRLDVDSRQTYIDLTLPVFSVASPLDTNISRASFIDLQANPGKVSALHFVGYVYFNISEAQLRNQVLAFSQNVVLGGLGIVLFAMIFTWLVTRRITSPLSTLVTLADDISLGKLDPISVHGAREIRQISERLNIIINNLASYKIKIDADNKMLGMKVELRTKELSVRNNELSKAIGEVTEAKNRLRKMAYIDGLTALPNRRYFNEQFQLLLNIAIREKHTLALIFIDIDNFKRINDSLGHNAGDQLLKEIATRLRSSIRESDMVHNEITGKTLLSRFGGDEFTVILYKIDQPESAGIVAKRLLTTLRHPMHIEGHEFVITPSIGIALAPEHGDETDSLIRHADTAMYHAKSAGKNSYQYYTSDMAEADVERLRLETDLRKAIERNELEIRFQPQVNILTGTIVGAEALLRWNHTELGYIPPLEFISLAEEAGIIGELGDWILQATCSHMKLFQELNLDLKNVSVNVSSLQFNNKFAAHLKDILTETELNPASLIVELTEGIIMDDTLETIALLKEVKNIGVGLSVDDFGTGYSSLSYLSRFPLNELKIDRSFVVDLNKSENDASLVVAIISMAKSLNLELVAEGVETVEQYNFLRTHGVKVVQGYIFSKPLSAEDFEMLLKYHRFDEQVRALSVEKQSALN